MESDLCTVNLGHVISKIFLIALPEIEIMALSILTRLALNTLTRNFSYFILIN